MKNLFYLLYFLFLIPLSGFTQTKSDSVVGTYHRHIVKVGTAGYIISTSDQELVLDKNHCVALTVKNTGGHFNPYFTADFMTNPQVYYGIWKVSGDTVIITYTKTCCELLQFQNDGNADGPIKMDSPIQNKYFWTGDNYLEPITESEKSVFYKGELEVVE